MTAAFHDRKLRRNNNSTRRLYRETPKIKISESWTTESKQEIDVQNKRFDP